MIGLGPHTMSAADWVFLGALQVGLVLAAAFAVWLAIRATQPRRGR
jgi:hypothetical protein